MSGTIYFVKCIDRIKIGYSSSLERRIKTLQTGSAHPLSLIASCSGSPALERAIHAHLTPHRAHGEWFYDCPQVLAVISDIVRHGGAAIGFYARPLEVRERRAPEDVASIEPIPDISAATLSSINASIIECRSIATEIDRKTRNKEDVSGLLTRLEFLAGVIGPTLFPHRASTNRNL